jgi:Phosphotransferase system, mannose/fructose-specific component IIA
MAISLILSSHGLYAQEALNSTKMIIGTPRIDVETISVTEGRSYDDCLAEIQEKYQKMKIDKEGVLVLVDIFGGTPANIASYLALTETRIQVYSGFNLPLLLELMALNPQTIEQAKEIIEMTYNNSLVDITKKLKEGSENGDNSNSY